MNGDRIAGIDVHKAMLAVVVEPAEREEKDWPRRKFGTSKSELRHLAAWLQGQGVTHAVMESTARYWRPVWLSLEPHLRLYLVHPMSNAAPRGRKMDFADATRLIKRFQANELRLSFVPEAEQRRWRELTRTRTSLWRDRVRVHNHIEALLEEGQLKLSTVVSDLLGVSGRRILQEIVKGERDPQRLAGLADGRLRATRSQLAEALEGELHPIDRTLLELHLERLEVFERQMLRLEQQLHEAQMEHQQTIQRLCAIPGVGLYAAEQILAEVGAGAKAFPTAAHLCSWVEVCPGRQESAGHSRSNRSAKGNRALRSLLTQVAWAAVRVKDSLFETLFRRWVSRLGPQKAIWAVAHRILRVVWKILHQGVEYIEFGPRQNAAARERRKNRLLRQLRRLGFDVEVKLTPTDIHVWS